MAKIKLRRDTSQNWNNIDPTLASGEPGYDTTNNKLKIGDGTTAWSELNYLTDELGSTDLGLFKFSGSIIGTKNNPDTGGWGAYDLVLNPGGESAASIYIPSVANQGEGYPIQISNTQDPTSAIQLFGRGGVQITTNTGENEKVFEFGDDGKLRLPIGSDILNSNGDSVLDTGVPSSIANNSFEVSIDSFGNILYPGSISQSHKDSTVCSPNTDTVVYTSTDQYKHAIKLFVMVEGTPDGGTVWETQACDVIGVRGYLNNTVYVTTYGVTYSSNTAFATFDGRWNATTSRMEIVCRPTSTTNTVVVSVHAIEITSND